jgi:mycofactocin system creatininase family protein
MTLSESAWPELRGDRLLLVPTGSCEQHGPHLPLDTDTRIARAVACRFGDEALVAPALAYGASGEHEQFPGTVSLGTAALHTLLVEFGRSACRWASRVVFVNGHGGNARALVSATRLLRYEGRDIAWFACDVPGADAHAGHAETAMLLALDAAAVRLDRAEAGNPAPVAELMARLRAGQLRETSPNGVLGDPAGATAERGRVMVEGLAARLRAAAGNWRVDEFGRLT